MKYLILILFTITGCNYKIDGKEDYLKDVCINGTKHMLFNTYSGYHLPVPKYVNGQIEVCNVKILGTKTIEHTTNCNNEECPK